MKKVNIFKLEDRVLFDAAGVADAVDAANQAASAEASAAQEQAQDSKEALKNAPPENPADAAANAQAQQNHSNPGEAADLDAAANKIVEGEIVPGQAPEQADAPADGADVDASAADTDGEAPDADHAAAESQGGDAGDSGDAGDAGDINDVPLGDIDDFINGGHDSDADHDGDAEHNAEQDSADADKPAPALDAVPAAANADAPGRELVIINSSVKDAQSIIDALGDNTDVLFLENGTDALDAINEYLDANGIKYDAIHIVSHGNAGYFVLNGEIIDAQSVANDPASWANIGKHLSDNGDIMIYGCNVAGNLDGQMLVSQIASLTGADVAASVDSTGVNGNWDLEYSIGVIDHQFINVSDYQYGLAAVTLTVDGSGSAADHFASFDDAYQFAINGSDEYTINITIDGAFATELDNTESSITITGNGLTVNDSTVTGDLTFNNSSVTLSGETDFSGTVNVNSGLVLNGNITTSGNGVLTVNGQMSGSGDITFDGTHVIAGHKGRVGKMTGGTVTYANTALEVLGGTYHNLTLAGTTANGSTSSYVLLADTTVNASLNVSGNSSIRVAHDLTVGSAASMGHLSDNIETRYVISDGASMTLYLTSQTVNGFFEVQDGTLNLEGNTVSFSRGARPIGIIGNNANAVININGTGLTFNAAVGLGQYGGTINVNGSSLVFNSHFTSAIGWYNTGDLNGYNPFDDRSYIANGSNRGISWQLGEDLANGQYSGTINIKSSGNVLFNGQVVSTGDFNIESGTVTFSATRLVAVAAGNFTISGGTVNFLGNVYVSTMFNGDLAGHKNQDNYASGIWNRSSVFTVKGGEVNFSADLVNWVRTYRGGYYKDGNNKIAFGDMDGYAYNNAQYVGLEFRQAVTSTVKFLDGTTTFGANSTYKAYGVFGEVFTEIGENAAVKFNEVRAMNFNAYTPSGAVQNGTAITWSAEWENEYGIKNPFQPTIEGVDRSGISNSETFTINANGTLTVAGDFISSGDYLFGLAYLYLYGGNNQFSGNFTNTIGSWMEIRGEGNSFYNMTNSGTNSAVLHVYAQTNFTSLTNSASFYVTDAGAVQIENFTNNGGETTIAGDNTGMSFTRTINISSGNVRLSSALGVDISADIDLGKEAIFEVSGANTFTGIITNSGTFNIAGRGVEIKGALTNNASGLISINGTEEPDYSTIGDLTAITGKLNNAGTININQAGLVFNALGMGFTNSGKLSVGKYTIFNNLTNTATGTVEFTKTIGTTRGSEGSVFVNLVNQGVLTVAVDDIIFRDGLTNSGTLRISGANVRFTNMVSSSGALTFVNTASGKIYLMAANNAAQRVDIDNQGTVEVNGSGAGMTYYFGQVKNPGSGSMYVNNLASIDIGGTLDNSGKIYGEGNLTLRAATVGNGTLAFTSGTVTYDYRDADAVILDADGYYRVNGVIVGDAYDNRPEYVDGVGWCYHGGTTPITALVNLGEFANISISSSGSWVVGGVDTGIAHGTAFAAPVIGSNGFWVYQGKETSVAVVVNQAVYGGSVYNMTIQGDAEVDAAGTKGVTLADGAELQIAGMFQNNDVQLVVAGSVAFNHTYLDTASSSLRIVDSGIVSFNVQTKDTATQRYTASVLGTVINDGKINVANGQELILNNTTGGVGTMNAAAAVVTFNDAAVSGGREQGVFSGSYLYLNLIGYSKTLDSGTIVADTLNNGLNFGETLAILNGSHLTVNQKAIGSGAYTVGFESQIDFNSQSGNGYEIGGDIEILSDAFGVNFNGAEKARIIVGGKLTNNVLVNEWEVRRTGVTASYAAFAEVENNGTFTVKDSGVQLGNFIQNAGAQLLFALQSGDVFAIDGVNSRITGNGGNIMVQGGKLTVSSRIDAASGDNAADFQVNKGAVLELAAAGQVLPYVIVDEGATLMISADAVLGTAAGAVGSSGLVLNGTLQTLGGEVTVYAYDTADHDDPTARIYVESGSKLTFVGEPGAYGFVYAAIEIAGGELNVDSPRLTHAVMDEWIVIDSDDFTSNYEAGSKFIVKNGATLTVDGYLNGKGLPVEEGAFRLVGNGSLLVSVDLTVTGDVTVNAGSTVTVNADAVFNGAFAGGGLINGSGNITFNGPVTTSVTDDSGVVQTGTVNMTGDSEITYGENAGNVLFGGTYANLIVNGVASVGDVRINRGLRGSGSVTFSGTTAGKAAVSGGTLSVTYEKEAKVVYGGEYGSLTFVGDHTVNAGSNEVLAINVAGTFAITGGTATSPVTLTLNNTDLTLEGELVGTDSARIDAKGQSTVTYNYSGYMPRDIYSGSYRELVIKGYGLQHIANLNLQTSLSGTGSLVIGLSTNGVKGKVDGNGQVVGGTLNVTYSENITENFLGGIYKDLSISGANNSVNNNITVAGNASVTGTFSGKGNLEFQGGMYGTATFGTDSTAYAGSVTYSAGSISGQTSQMVYGGNYSLLILSGLAKTVDSNLTAGHLVTGSDVAIGNKAVVTFHQVTVNGSAPTIQIGAGSTLNITMTAGVAQPRLNNAGTLVVSSNGAYTFTGDTLTNDGVFRVAGNSEVTLDNIKMNNSLSSYAVDAGSTLNMTGFLATDAEGKEVPVVIAGITNNGNLNILGSNLTVTGAVTNTGTFTVDQGSTLTLEGNSTLDGTFILNNGNILNIFGEVRINDLYTYGKIQVGSEDGRTGSLTLYKVSAGNKDPESSWMTANEGSTLKFDPWTSPQWIGGTVTIWQTPDHNPLQHDPDRTKFYNLVIETSWIIVNEDGYVIDVTTDGKYWIQDGAHVTVNGCGAGSQFRVDGDCELTFSITATGGNPDAAVQSVEVYAGGKVVIDSALSVTGSFTNSGDVTVNAAGTKFALFTNEAEASLTLNAALNAESKVVNMVGGTITVNAAMTLDGNISNDGTISVTSAGVTVNGLVNGKDGIVQVGEAGVLTVETDLDDGTLKVLENGQAVINVDALTANVENAGTVTAGTGTLTFNGAVIGNGGTFSGDSLTFSGITSGTATVEAADVIYNGTDSQSVFGGTYGTLTLDDGVKTVTGKTEVTGVFTNNSGVQVDGSLTLNGVEGAGEYLVSQNGMLVFNGSAGSVLGTVNNFGIVNVDGVVKFEQGIVNDDKGVLNLNAADLDVTVTNTANASVNVAGTNVILRGDNSGVVKVMAAGSADLYMSDREGAVYSVEQGGTLNLYTTGTLNGTVSNEGEFNVESNVSFAGSVVNAETGVMTVVENSTVRFANIMTNNGKLVLDGVAFLDKVVNHNEIQLKNIDVVVNGLRNYGTLDIKADGYKFDASKFTNDGLVKVSNGATVTADNIGANGSSGDYSVEANSTLNAGTDARFTGVLQNDGTISGNGNLITISGSTAGSGSLNNSSGEVVYNGADAQDIFSGEYGRLTVTGDGTKTLNGDITINTNGNISSSFVNNGVITSHGALIFDGKTSGNGTVDSTAETIYNQAAEHVYSGKYGKLTLSGVAKSIAGNVTADLLDNSARTLTVETSGVLTTGKLADDVNSQYNILGTWNFTGDAEILGSVNNSGVISTDSDLTFTGMTTGSGRIEISNTTGAVKYSGNADHEIYSGNYNDLTIDGTGNNTLSGDVKVNGTMSLDTRLNASGSLTLSGDTTGEGQLHSTGSVVYDRNGDQDIYNGSYKDITIDGNGVKSIVGNVTISGNAVQSGGAVLHASNGNVTYNGNGTQQVMNGTYDDLTLNGTGQKLFAAGSLTTVNGTFTATGSPSQLLYLDSTIPGRQWDVAAGNLNFNWVHISNSNLLSGGADLNGNNSLGSGNTGWKVFDSAGGIGDSFPSQNNLNFSSLAMLLGNELRAAELEELFYEEGFVFRRSGSLPKLDPNGDDIAAVLQSEVDFLGLETAYDTAIFDGADFSDADYSDLMSRADIFKDEVDEALSEMVAI